MVSELQAGRGDSIASRLQTIEARIVGATRRSGRTPSEVTLLAVSKTVDVEDVRRAVAAGLTTFGENRAQDLVAKARSVLGCSWHMIGAVQRNKVAMLAPHVSLWHTVDRASLVDVIARHCDGARVLIEVNVGNEATKAGCSRDELDALLEYAKASGLDVAGLMCVPPAADDPRRHFEWMQTRAASERLDVLSMGMSGDFEVAIEYGATIVRIGTAIFGPRPTTRAART